MHRATLMVSQLVIWCVLIGTESWAGDIDDVSVRVWHVGEEGPVVVPELEDEAVAVPWLAGRPSFGLAFSGGGTRSASASLGQLRILSELGWVERARFITANSGGSWITVPFTYLPASIEDRRFLGAYIPPGKLNDENLEPDEVDPLAFETAIHDATTFDRAAGLGRGDEAYSDIVGEIFLEPFGLHDNEKFFTFHRGALDAILAGNPDLSADNFQLIERENRPYLVITGVMLGQQMSEDPDEYYPIEMTPLYTGIRGRFELDKDGETVIVGGGYVESFGYDSYEPHQRQANGRYTVRISGMIRRGDNPFDDRYRFTLSDVIGTSSAAPLATLSRNTIPNFLFPEFRHWSIDRAAIDASDERVRRWSDEFQHGDGADMDNLSVTSLLARGTENIISFVNTSTPFSVPDGGCGNVTDENITDDMISFFRPNRRLVHNVVLDNGEANLETLCEAFADRKESGEPLIYCQAYDVIRNSRYRIEPYEANICWVYLDRVGQWMDQLDPSGSELVQDILDQEGSFDSFPHYSTFAEHAVGLIDLDRERVIALSNLAAWTLRERAGYIAGHLASAELPVSNGQ